MKIRKLRIALVILLALVALAIATVFLSPLLFKTLVERRIAAATGMPTTIGSLELHPFTSSIRVRNFKMSNPPGFGATNFLEMPDLFLQFDRAALRAGRLLIKTVRVDIASIAVVEKPDGTSNVETLQKGNGKVARQTEVRTTNAPSSSMPFDGIELLNVSVGRIQFINQRDPTKSWSGDLNISNESFHNLKTELDFQTAMIVLILKAGLSGSLDFETLLESSFKPKKKPRPVVPGPIGPKVAASTNSAPSK